MVCICMIKNTPFYLLALVSNLEVKVILLAMASTLLAMASTLKAMASNLIAKASTVVAMAFHPKSI